MFHLVSLNNPEGVLSTDSVSDLKMIGVFRSKTIFPLRNLSRE